ncbi:hypothetical protein D3C73_1043960 [compost metagenome]
MFNRLALQVDGGNGLHGNLRPPYSRFGDMPCRDGFISQLMRENALIGDFGGGDRLLHKLGCPYRPFCKLYKRNAAVRQMTAGNFTVSNMAAVHTFRA